MRWPGKKTAEEQLDKELGFHFEAQVRDYIAAGMTEQAARRRTRLEFGALDQIKDECRDVRPRAWLDDLLQDLKFALRSFRKNPGFTASCVLTLAVAIGANTAVFGTLRTLVLNSLPYRDSDRLAVLWTDDSRRGIHVEGVSFPNLEDWRRLNRSFESMSFFVRTNDTQLTLPGPDAERVQIAAVPPGFFHILGVEPLRGRIFTDQEQSQRAAVVLISENLWTRRFGRSDQALSAELELEGRRVQVIGVLPRPFQFPYWNTDLWFPYTTWIDAWLIHKFRNREVAQRVLNQRYSDWLGVVARLKPGVTFDKAREDMARVGQILSLEHPSPPHDWAGFGVAVFPLFDHLYGDYLRPALWIVFGAVVTVLLIGSSNIGSLLLARAETRRHEFIVRRALGASKTRLTRQLLAESGLLSVASALVGLSLAHAGLKVAIHFAGPYVPRLTEAGLRGDVLLFTTAVTALTALLCGCAPAWRVRQDSASGLVSARASVDSRGRFTLNALVVAQVALAVVLCTAAGLLLRSFLKIAATPLGYKPEQLLVFDLINRTYGYSSPQEQGAHIRRVTREVMERIQTLPGVTGVAATDSLFIERNPDVSVFINGVARSDVPLTTASVSAGYFQVLGVRLLRGRFFSPEEERTPRRSTVIINDYMARHFWPGQDPIGRTLGRDQRLRTIVGVVEDMRLQGREKDPVGQIFSPASEGSAANIVVRSRGNPAGLGEAIRAIVREVDRGAVAFRMSTVDRHLDAMQAPRNFQTALVGFFSVVAVGLAVFGSYSVLQYATSQRRKEFGIRIALGATPVDLARSVLSRGMAVALAGVAAGLFGSIWLTKLMSGLLYAVSPFDLPTYVAVTASLIAVLAIAALIPAYRSSRVDPLQSLRHE